MGLMITIGKSRVWLYIHNYCSNMHAYAAIMAHSTVTCFIYVTVGMKVLYAYYGISCASNIDHANQDRTTDWAKGLCDGKVSCSGRVHTSVLTDPYPGCAKDFLVVAECANGKIISNLVTREAQGKDFSLQCPCWIHFHVTVVNLNWTIHS